MAGAAQGVTRRRRLLSGWRCSRRPVVYTPPLVLGPLRRGPGRILAMPACVVATAPRYGRASDILIATFLAGFDLRVPAMLFER